MLDKRAGGFSVPVYLGDSMQLSIKQDMIEKELVIQVPPPKAGETHEFSAWASLSDADLGKQYGALIASDANGPARLASADAKLFNRARAAFQQSAR